MSGVEHCKSFINRLTAHLSERPEQDENEDVPDNKDSINDASLFKTASPNSVSGQDIYGNPTLGTGAEDDVLYVHLDSENRQNLQLHEFENSNTEDTGGGGGVDCPIGHG